MQKQENKKEAEEGDKAELKKDEKKVESQQSNGMAQLSASSYGDLSHYKPFSLNAQLVDLTCHSQEHKTEEDNLTIHHLNKRLKKVDKDNIPYIELSDTEVDTATLDMEDYLSLDKPGRALVDKYLTANNHHFPVKEMPCGGHNWINSVPINAHVLNNIGRPVWIASDAMDLLAGAMSANSPSICILTSAPTHHTSAASCITTEDKYSSFVAAATREIRDVHMNLPANGRAPPVIAMPLNIGDYHWILLLAYPSLAVVEVMDSGSDSKDAPHMAEVQFWVPAIKLLCESMVGWNVQSSQEWTIAPTCRTAPGQTNGIDCGRFVLWYIWSLGQAFAVWDPSSHRDSPRCVRARYKTTQYVQSKGGRVELIRILLEFVSRFLDTELWLEHKNSVKASSAS